MSKKTSPSTQAEVKKPVVSQAKKQAEKKPVVSQAKKQAEKKPVVSPELASKALNLRQRYLALSKNEQNACVHFFNLHNNAGWIYNELISQDARDYIDLQVAYSQELAVVESMQNVPDTFELDQTLNGDGKEGL